MTFFEKFFILIIANFLALSNGFYVDHGRNTRSSINENSNEIPKPTCQTPGCIHAASAILKNMDPAVDPCDDFYGFACGGFVRDAIIPDYLAEVSSFSSIDKELMQKLRIIIEERITDDDPRPFRLLRSFYRACMNTTQTNLNGEKNVRNLMESLGDWPVLLGKEWNEKDWDWMETLAKFQKLGFSSDLLVNLDLDVDLLNNTKYVFMLDQGSVGLPPEYMKEGLDNLVVQYYFQLMLDLAEYLGADMEVAENELMNVIELQTSLARISSTDEQRREISSLYNPTTIEKFSKKHSYLPWLDYINSLVGPYVKLDKDDTIVIIYPEYFDKLEEIMINTPKRTMANYFMWHMLISSSWYMGQNVQAILSEFIYAVVGTSENMPAWEGCVAVATGQLSLAAGALYVRTHFNDDAKQNAVEMIERIKMSFKDMLEKVTWMDEQTRKAALQKLDTIVSFIAYPDELKDDSKLEEFYKDLDIDPDDFLKSTLNIQVFGTAYALQLYSKPVNKSSWVNHGQSAIVNAFYDPSENSMMFPAGILQGVYFDNNRPKYLNYGSIGFIMGHEMTHGFDDRGRQFDKSGNLVNWWDEETAKQYLDRAQCIIDQYANYTVREIGEHINGVTTQGENIADNGGIKEAYLAYNTWEKENGVEPALPGLPYTSQQMFWISAANVWCTKVRPEAMQLSVTLDSHSPGEFRVRGPLSNTPDFAKDFNCPLGSTMNPVKKCTVW